MRILGIDDQTITNPAQISEKLREANKLQSLEQVRLIRSWLQPGFTGKFEWISLACFSDRDEATRLCQDGAFLDGSRHVARPYVAGEFFEQCKKCWRLGHWEGHCRSQPRCRRCGSTGHSEEHCTKKGGEKCVNCGGGHFASGKTCPKRKEENEAVNARRLDGTHGPTRFEEAPSSVTPAAATRSGLASTGAEVGSGPAENPALHSGEPEPWINTRVGQGETDMEWEQETAATTEQEMEASHAGSSRSIPWASEVGRPSALDVAASVPGQQGLGFEAPARKMAQSPRKWKRPDNSELDGPIALEALEPEDPEIQNTGPLLLPEAPHPLKGRQGSTITNHNSDLNGS